MLFLDMSCSEVTFLKYFLYIYIFLFFLFWSDGNLQRFDFSGKGDEEQQEETDEKKRVLVISKLHAILRPFLLRRMKEDVEQMLPRKKEIIIYANMTAHQRQIQTHLIEKTFDNYLHENTDIGMHVYSCACLPSYQQSNLCTSKQLILI